MLAYHVVTERPMYVGQRIVFDETHHSGVYQRVLAKKDLVDAIYADPTGYDAAALEHHTSVALRELALEEVRRMSYPQYPSRLACLYVSASLEEAEEWGRYFSDIGRPTYHIVELDVNGRCFVGDAAKCFAGRPNKEENLRLAELYWKNDVCTTDTRVIRELLVDGQLTVVRIVKEINKNILQL